MKKVWITVSYGNLKQYKLFKNTMIEKSYNHDIWENKLLSIIRVIYMTDLSVIYSRRMYCFM